MAESTFDTGTDFLQVGVEDGVMTITMNRPERRNALHPDMYPAFDRALTAARFDDGIRAVMITGAGKAFCAGGDVQAMRARNEGGGSPMTIEDRITDLRYRQGQVSAAIHEHPKVVIAAIPGPAAGAGLSIALACDLRIASENAILTTAFSKVGFSGDFGGSWFLTQLVGTAKARELYFSADRIEAKEAEQLGIVNRVVSDTLFEDEAMAWAKKIASGPTVALRYIKENLNRAIRFDLRTCLDAEAIAMSRLGSTHDHQEAVKAFLEKRDPTFEGR